MKKKRMLSFNTYLMVYEWNDGRENAKMTLHHQKKEILIKNDELQPLHDSNNRIDC